MGASLEDLEQQHIVLTGANRGIGLELCRQLLAAKAQITVGIRAVAEAKELAALAKEAGKQLDIQTLDITKDDSVQSFAKALGARQVDILINNAGVNVDRGHDASDLPLEVLSQTLDANTLGPIRMVQALKDHLDRAKKPIVANISSVMGSIGENEGGGAVAYRMSKTALNQYSRCLAIEQQHWVVLSLHPGWVKTRMGGQNAQIETKESATGLLQVISQAGKEQSGRFFRYSGETVSW